MYKYEINCDYLQTGWEKFFMAFEALMTIEEVADYLRVKKRTIYEWLKSGKIPAIKAVGQWRFKKDKIDAWLDSQRQ
jgi:excisionase family DNA binding protein